MAEPGGGRYAGAMTTAGLHDFRLKPARGAIAHGLATLGVVFGDIGTSPLYALSLLFLRHRGVLSQAQIYGGISLVVWALTLVVALKYAIIVLRADNDGEGGVFALYGLLDKVNRGGRSLLAWSLLLGAGLLFGDGMITPAISVLSAVEGLSVATPMLADAVVPATLVLLTLLFAVQHKGTRKVGRVFGPVMLIWFVAIGSIGLVHLLRHPEILHALSPLYGIRLLAGGDLYAALVILGAVMLVVTGGEAMYADMGHFGARPIRRAWFAIVYPALLLTYLGQGAFLLETQTPIHANLFFHMVPQAMVWPLVILATLATVIASQALISGTFSLVSQAIALGFFPQLLIRHTHHRQAGEVYVPFINWTLLLGCIALVLGFGSSAALGSAYGLAVSGVMITTSTALYFLARHVWGWSGLRAALVMVPLALVDAGFLLANSLKLADGGYVPLAMGLLMFAMMLTWNWGRRRTTSAYLARRTMCMSELIERHRAASRHIDRTAVLMVPPRTCVRSTMRVPALLQMLWDRNGILARDIIFVQVVHPRVPYVREERFETTVLEQNAHGSIMRVEMRFGFMELPDVERGLELLAKEKRTGLEQDHRKWIVHVAREHLAGAPGMRPWSAIRFRFYELLRLISQPAYYHYGLGYDVQLTVEILPVRFS